MNNKYDEITRVLFDRRYCSDIDEDTEDELLDLVDSQIRNIGWADTFKNWEQYLHQECKTPDSVINFANLFWWYGGQDHVISEPYHFLGYFYYVVGSDVDKYDNGRILDSIATSILPKAGFSEANLALHPDYVPENDPMIIKEAQGYAIHE